jgi:hypothetical protein
MRRNQVTPFGELVAHPARAALVFGNRGCLHDEHGEIRRHHVGRRWIACRMKFKGRRRSPLMQPGRYTELFFLDDATALAAGHRPCAECRREDFRTFAAGERVDPIDRRLHRERLAGPHREPFDELPDGVFVLLGDEPWVVQRDQVLQWAPSGYAAAAPRPHGDATVVTPRSTVEVLRSGWTSSLPLIHP